MKIAIIDDNSHWRTQAQDLIRQHYYNTDFDLDIYENGEQYLKSRICYDISFVDIEMPVIDGFKTISKAREYNADGIFIIMTTHLEMSRKGFHVNAFRYIDKADLENEINEALTSAALLMSRYETIKVNIINAGVHELTLNDIIYIETEKHYIVVHTTDNTIKCSDRISDIEESLCSKWFFRSHKTYIVNLDKVAGIRNMKAVMSNDDIVDIAHRRFTEFKRAYINRHFDCANG